MKNDAEFKKGLRLLALAHVWDAAMFVAKVVVAGYIIHLIIH